ncbi:hypothetical protein D917_05196 [Trichinella nativa]|uniref:Uncharacterized protein n=1 Tax=Trichinella nativa TaxID=6335 RepID=A0A1Y3EWS6_9BILA|nr:hypothetical protein D917_05196 [Trichinella nativa]
MQIPTNSCPRKLLRWLNSYYYPCDAAVMLELVVLIKFVVIIDHYTKGTATRDIWCNLFDLNEIQILHKICACRYEYLWRSPARVRQIGMAVFNLMQSYSTATSQTNVLLIAIRILAELTNGSRNC